MNNSLLKKTILLVDDELSLREIMVDVFDGQGANILQASGGKEALEVVKKKQVDLVISDIRMPLGNGVDFLKQVTTLDILNRPKVMLVSGFADYDIADLYEMGADGFIPKPFQFENMLQLANRTLTPLELKFNTTPSSLLDAKKVKFSDQNRVRWGRGGFSLYSDVFYNLLTPIHFDIANVKGIGLVRWSMQGAVGVEVFYAEPTSRDQVISLIQAESANVPFLRKLK